MTENSSFNRYFDGRPVEPMTAYEKAELAREKRLAELEYRVAKLEVLEAKQAVEMIESEYSERESNP